MTRAATSQSGFAIVSSIFLIVVLAALGVYMVTLSGVEHATSSQTLTASRVYYGAKAGLEWGIHGAIAADGSCAASTSFPLTGTGLNGISVTVTCNSTTHAGVFYITSQATYGTYGTLDYSQRRMEATVANF